MNPLNQSLHILRKDVRHLYPEISVSLSLVALFAWIAPAGWPAYLTRMSYPGPLFVPYQMLGILLHALIPLSWLILISRLVHDESLVGDKQFWVTRPYTWYSLLTAKLLFIAGFLGLPLLLAQAYLIHCAGLSVLSSLPALLSNLGMIALLFFLPFTVLAAVTSSFGPLILMVLGGILYLGLVGLLGAYLHGMSAVAPYTLNGLLVVFALLLVAILVYQYIQRKTGLFQLLLLATPFVIIALLLLAPANLLFAHAYPEIATVSAKVDLDPMKQQPSSGPLLLVGTTDQNMVLTLPIAVTGVSAGQLLDGNAMRVELTSSSGFHWVSPWQVSSETLRNGLSPLNIQIPATVVQRIGNETVKLRLSLALERLDSDAPVAFQIGSLNHSVPGGGVCSLVGEFGFPQTVCRYSLQSPLTLVETEVSDRMCPLDGATPTTPMSSVRATIAQNSNVLSFDPTVTRTLSLESVSYPNGQPRTEVICPGSHMQLTGTHPAGGEQIHVEQTGIELTPYLVHRSVQKQKVQVDPEQPQE